MKRPHLLATIAAGALLAGCAGVPPAGTPKTRVSPDYEASGDVSGVRAFVYGSRTVIEFDNRPMWLTVQDENGVSVKFEREGRYYRLERKLGAFSVWANTRALSFSTAPGNDKRALAHGAPVASSAPPGPFLVTAPGPAATATVAAIQTPTDDAQALLNLSAAQLDEVRQTLNKGSTSQNEARALRARLDRIEAKLVTAATVMVRVQFKSAATSFDADPALARALVPVAKAADRINVRGRTDSKAAGESDPAIALGRALAVRKFLLESGVDGTKIKVFALPAGDFIAPAGTEEGRALNRRVEIELVSRRFAELQRQVVVVAENEP